MFACSCVRAHVYVCLCRQRSGGQLDLDDRVKEFIGRRFKDSIVEQDIMLLPYKIAYKGGKPLFSDTARRLYSKSSSVLGDG